MRLAFTITSCAETVERLFVLRHRSEFGYNLSAVITSIFVNRHYPIPLLSSDLFQFTAAIKKQKPHNIAEP